MINKAAFFLHMEMMNAREDGNVILSIDLFLQIDTFKLKIYIPLLNHNKIILES